MQKIIIQACDVWDYFHKHRAELKENEYTIATNDVYGVEIAVTEEEGLPCLIVTADGYQYAEERAVSAKDCKEIVETLYENFLTSEFINIKDDDESRVDQEDMIDERELELDDAMFAFLDVILEEDTTAFLGTDADEISEDLKDHILEYLYRKHEISIRRPMVLIDSNGEEFFEEYPYEHMEFEHENNPIFNKQ